MRALVFTACVTYSARELPYNPILFLGSSGLSLLALLILLRQGDSLKSYEQYALIMAAFGLQGVQVAVVYGRYSFKPSIVPIVFHTAMMLGLETNI